MPQVHNRSVLLDGNAFGRNSRFMNTLKFTDTTKRRVRAFNVVENKLNRYKLKYYDRQAEIEFNRAQRQREQLLVKMKRLMAYKLVAESHNLSTARNYHESLNEDRSPRIIKKEVNEMIKQISPQYIRERRAREKIEEARKRYDDILINNRKQIDVIYPSQLKWKPYRDEQEDDDKSTATTPISAPPEMNPELRMRRLTLPQRRITLGVSKAYVMEKSNLGEKLEKEKTALEQQPQGHNLSSTQTENTADDQINTKPANLQNDNVTAHTEQSNEKHDLPPVVIRRSSIKNDSKKTKPKRSQKSDYELAPVSLSKKIKPELDVRNH